MRLWSFSILILLQTSCGIPPDSQLSVIYGEDQRQQISPKQQDRARAVGLQLLRQGLKDRGDGTYLYSNYFIGKNDSRAATPYCEEERFHDSPVLGLGTGFLFGNQNTWVTAGHVLEQEGNCQDYAFVIDYNEMSRNQVWRFDDRGNLIIKKTNVYLCESIEKRVVGSDRDFTIARLRTKVPLNIAKALKPANPNWKQTFTAVSMIGHPLGLSAKYVSPAPIRDDHEGDFMRVELDAYTGNSGSPVFASDSAGVVGLLKGGESDFVLDNTTEPACLRSKICQGKICAGEKVSYFPMKIKD